MGKFDLLVRVLSHQLVPLAIPPAPSRSERERAGLVAEIRRAIALEGGVADLQVLAYRTGIAPTRVRELLRAEVDAGRLQSWRDARCTHGRLLYAEPPSREGALS